jgi:hypothetical protein
MVIDMVEAFSPGFYTLLLEIDELHAKTAPEPCLRVASDVAGLGLRYEIITIRDRVIFL